MEIETTNVSITYQDGEKERIVLRDINLKLDNTAANVIVGPSGSGKSSLLYVLSSLRNPSSGTIRYSFHSASNHGIAEELRYQHFGFVFQQPFLIPYLTAVENILMARKEVDLSEKAYMWLKRFELESVAKKFPHQLSGGERQRIAVIRALVKEPDVIFADEPTASLDKENACLIFDTLKKESTGKILVVATHDLSLLHGNEKIFRIDHCQIVSSDEVH